MANALKRMSLSGNKEFKERCKYFMYQHAKAVLDSASPDVNDLKLAQHVWSGLADYQNIALIVLTNATIGSHCDNDETILDSELEYVISTEDKFNTIANTLVSAGVI